MTTSRILSYGALGLPLAFAALPIYVHVPRFYADIAGMELAVLGTILLGARLLGVYGQITRQGSVVHLHAKRVVDRSPLLGQLATHSRDFH